MYKYSVLVQWSEVDQCYITSVPELPGCMADGATPAEAFENTQIIIKEWIETAREEGREVPTPVLYELVK